jgi:repressor LexA
MLTRKQYELLIFIHQRIRETGVPPSFDEMKDALDLKSKSGIHRLITALEERGYIRRLEKRARALEVIRLPENASDGVRPAATRTQAQRLARPEPGARPLRLETREHRIENRIPADTRQAAGHFRRVDSDAVLSVPVLGRIAAGTPIEAIQHKISEVGVRS